jgi:hypothetical protein
MGHPHPREDTQFVGAYPNGLHGQTWRCRESKRDPYASAELVLRDVVGWAESISPQAAPVVEEQPTLLQRRSCVDDAEERVRAEGFADIAVYETTVAVCFVASRDHQETARGVPCGPMVERCLRPPNASACASTILTLSDRQRSHARACCLTGYLMVPLQGPGLSAWRATSDLRPPAPSIAESSICAHTAIKATLAVLIPNWALLSGSNCAQPCGSRIRHEDEKNSSAIIVRILQTCR